LVTAGRLKLFLVAGEAAGHALKKNFDKNDLSDTVGK
jgi:hypothetical protein